MDVNIFETQMLLLSGPLPSYQADASKATFPETTDIDDGNDFMSHLQDEVEAQSATSYDQDDAAARDDASDDEESYADNENASDADTSATEESATNTAANDVDEDTSESDEVVAAMVNDLRKKSKESSHMDKALESLLASAVNSKEHAQALNAQLQKKGSKKLSEIMETLLQAVPQDQRQAFLKKLKALAEKTELKAIPEVAKKGIEKAVSKEKKGAAEDVLEGLLKTIKTTADKDEDKDLSALVATGLSPQELTKIYDSIMDALNGKNTEDAANTIGALIKIKSALGQDDKLNMPSSPLAALTGDELALAGPAGKDKILSSFAAKLNALITGGKSKKTGGNSLKVDLGEMAKVIESAQQNAGAQKADGTQNALPKPTSPTSLMSPAMLNALNENFISLNAVGMESVDAEIVSTLQAKNLNITNLNNLTNVSQHAQQASQPHPATKMVASQITKAVTEGQTRINIRLNPPELGRVEIRMEFNEASNSVKAHVIAEKPETYLMMQRDAHMLEKALQDSGLDIDGSGINFELAQDQNLFDHNDRRDGQGSSSSGDKSAKDEGEEEIIETTMDWYFDPNAGVMRYDVLV